MKDKIVDYMDDHPIFACFIIAGLVLVLLVELYVFASYVEVGFKPFHYEYIGSDGQTYMATYCVVPYKRQAYCRLEDGSTVLDFQSYKKVVDE